MSAHDRRRAYLAWITVCIVWGTTYLGIRIAVESFSPPTLMCLRYLISGGALLAPSGTEEGKCRRRPGVVDHHHLVDDHHHHLPGPVHDDQRAG